MPKVKDDEVELFEQLIDSMQLVQSEEKINSEMNDLNMNNDVKDLSTNKEFNNFNNNKNFIMDSNIDNYGEISKNIEIIDMADPEFIFNPSYQ